MTKSTTSLITMSKRLARILFISLIWLFCWGKWTFAHPIGSWVTNDNPKALPDSLKDRSPTGAMLRSLLVPGWGQFYNGKWFKAILVIGVETGLTANAFYLDSRLDNSTDALAREFYRNNRNLSYWWLGATLLLSMLDAYVDAHLYHFDESSNLSLQLSSQGNLNCSQEQVKQIIISWQLNF